MNTPIRDIARGEALTGVRLSEPYPIIRSVQTITGVGCEVLQIPTALGGGTTIRVPPKSGDQPTIIGKVVKNGPAKPGDSTNTPQADYSDARYWVQIEYVNTAGVYDALSLEDEQALTLNKVQQAPVIVTATNLGEYNAGTHSLATDGSVYVTCLGFYDKGTPQTLHWLFSSGTATKPGVFPVTLSSPSGSAGTNVPPVAATYTYTMVDAVTGHSYGSGFGPVWNRQPGQVTTAATHGAAYLDSGGTPHLAFCDEVIAATNCT